MRQICENISCVTFDVGFTLLFPRTSLIDIYREVLQQNGLVINDLDHQVNEAWQQICRKKNGLIYGKNYHDALNNWRILLSKITIKQFITKSKINSLAEKLVTAFSSHENWQLNPHWPQIYSYCRNKKWQIGLISNWDINLAKLLPHYNLNSMSDFVIISSECGLEKPDPRIFNLALEYSGEKPHHHLHVGDSWQDDVMGALNSNMHSIWFNHRKEIPALYHENLQVVTDLLGVFS